MVFISNKPKRTPGERIVRFLTGLVVVSALVWGFYSLPYDILREERARMYGEEISTAMVLEAVTDESGEYPDAKVLIRYKYVDHDGYSRTAVARIPNSMWGKYRTGMVVRVYLVSTRPDISRVEDEVEPAFQTWLRSVLN